MHQESSKTYSLSPCVGETMFFEIAGHPCQLTIPPILQIPGHGSGGWSSPVPSTRLTAGWLKWAGT